MNEEAARQQNKRPIMDTPLTWPRHLFFNVSVRGDQGQDRSSVPPPCRDRWRVFSFNLSLTTPDRGMKHDSRPWHEAGLQTLVWSATPDRGIKQDSRPWHEAGLQTLVWSRTPERGMKQDSRPWHEARLQTVAWSTTSDWNMKHDSMPWHEAWLQT